MYMAVLNFCRAGQRSGSCVANAAAAAISSNAARNAAAAHLESASSFHIHTAAAGMSSNAACNAAAGHGEGSTQIHTAATTGRTAYDIAAGHGEGAAGYNYHAAAIIIIGIGVAAGDDAAVDSVRAVCLVQYPEFCALVNLETVRGAGGAVRQRQIAIVLYLNHSAGAGPFQHIAVQVEGNSAADRQRGVDFNVCYQLDDCSSTFQRSGQIVRRGNFGWCPLCQCRRGQQAQAQGQRHEQAQNSFFHGISSFV